MALNVTTAVFGENCNTATASPSLAQWDKGQVLQISGVDLPDAYQVEFSTVYTRNAIPVIGNASGVQVPNELLQRSAPITACVVLHSTANSRDTEYWVTIHITPRKPPETITPDPEQADVIDQAIAALQDGTARAEAAATAAAGSATAADGSAENAEAWAVGQRANEDVPDTDPTYHNNSKYYAGRAEAAAEEAGQHEASWESWVRRAEAAADDAEGSARAAAGSKADAETAAQTATQKATESGNSAAAASGSASEARQTVDGAIGAINTAKEGALTAIGSAGSNAVGAVNQAGTTQTERVTTEGNTQVNRVQEKGDEVIGSIPPDYSDLADDVADLSRQISDLQPLADLPISTIMNDKIIQGTYSTGGAVYNSDNRIRIYGTVTVSAGSILYFTTGEVITDFLYGIYNGNTQVEQSEWITSNETPTAVRLGHSGELVIVFRATDNRKITPADYDATTKLMLYTKHYVSNGVALYKEYLRGIDGLSAYSDRRLTTELLNAPFFIKPSEGYKVTSVTRFLPDRITFVSQSTPPHPESWKETDGAYLYAITFAKQDANEYITDTDAPKAIEILNRNILRELTIAKQYVSEEYQADTLTNLQCTDIYDIYDGLCNLYPHIIAKETDIGTDAANNGIRHYTVRPQSPVINRSEQNISDNEWHLGYDYKHIIINAGIHGNEKSSVYGVAMLVKDIVEGTDDWSVYIRNNVILDIIPIQNPYGFDHNQRNNANDVDVCFSYDNVVQPEAIAMVDLIDNLGSKAFALIDSHNVIGLVNFFEERPTDPYFGAQTGLCAKIGGIINSTWAPIINNTSLYPYIHMCIGLSDKSYKSLTWYIATRGMYGLTVESVRNVNGTDVCVKQTSKFTKDMIGNMLSAFVDA